MAAPLFLAIGSSDDSLMSGVLDAVRKTGTPTCALGAESLSDHAVSICGSRFAFEGRAIGGILFRSTPYSHFSATFAEGDQYFADVETRSLWLAALHLASVLSLNRHDAVSWFDDSNWAEWRRELVTVGIPVAPFRFTSSSVRKGESWLPFRSTSIRRPPADPILRSVGASLTTSLPRARYALAGAELYPKPPEAVANTGSLLRSRGIELAEIVTDELSRVCWVNTLPTFESSVLERAVAAIAELWRDHLRIW